LDYLKINLIKIYILIFFLLIIFGVWRFINKRKNVLLFLLNIELIIIFLTIIGSIKFNNIFIFIILIGVMEAIIGLCLIIFFIRIYGNDYVNLC